MEWPLNGGSARLIEIRPDEEAGELYITAVFDEKTEQDIVYKEMFCQPFTDNSEGLVITSVKKITPEQLESSFGIYEDCGLSEKFVSAMYSMGNSLYAHRASDGREYYVLAMDVSFGKTHFYEKLESEQDEGIWACGE
jgi:hypothetical protein